MSDCTKDICADRVESMIRNAGAVSHAGLVLKSHCIAASVEVHNAALEQAATLVANDPLLSNYSRRTLPDKIRELKDK